MFVRALVRNVSDRERTVASQERPGRVDESLAADVLFAVDSATLTAQAQTTLTELAGRLRERAAGAVSVVGHTDTTGDGAYNEQLSLRRAGAVATALQPQVGAGVQLQAEGRGEQEPVADEATAEGALLLLGTSSRVRVDVLEVRAGEESTLLRRRLASPTTEEVDTRTSVLSFPLGFDARQVALVSAQERLQPFTFVPQRDIAGGDAGCVCSDLPERVGPDGFPLSALYPPLADGTEQVDVVPGVATLTGVPVTR